MIRFWQHEVLELSYDTTLRCDVFTSSGYWNDTADGGRIWLDLTDDGLDIAGRTTSGVWIKSAIHHSSVAANSGFAVHLETDAGHRMLAYAPTRPARKGGTG